MGPQAVPGGSKPPMDAKKKKQLAAGAALVAAVAGFALWKSKASGTAASSGSSSGTTSGTDTGTSTPYSYGGDGTGADDDSGLDDSLSSIQEQLATLVADSNPPGSTTTSGAGGTSSTGTGTTTTAKKLDFWQQAIGALKAAGDKNPTNKQIGAERNTLRSDAGLKKIKAKKKPRVVTGRVKPGTTGGVAPGRITAVPAVRKKARKA
jgi:hypothetical protein